VKGLDSGNLNREIVENTNAYCVLKQERIAGAAKPGIEIVGIDVLVDRHHRLADRGRARSMPLPGAPEIKSITS
jgi:hypothetical protein